MRLFWVAMVLMLVPGLGLRAADPPPAALASAVKAYATAAGDLETPRFRYALIDLDGDGRDDAVVLLESATWCGSGGCTMVVLHGTAGGFSPVSRSTITSEPVRVSAEIQRGWHTLIVATRSGDAVMRFDGRRYPLNPSVQPLAMSAQIKAARTIIE